MNTLSTNLLDLTRRVDFRGWLSKYHATAGECRLHVSKAYPTPVDVISYLDAVEEALCFGWIDSVHKIWRGTDMQRFSPRRRNSVWSELNKERCRRLERLGLMQPTGRAVLPDIARHVGAWLCHCPRILASFQAKPQAWTNFLAMPPLYQRVRIDTIQRDRSDMNRFNARIQRLIDSAAQGKLIGGMTMVGFSRYKSPPLISPSRLLSQQAAK